MESSWKRRLIRIGEIVKTGGTREIHLDDAYRQGLRELDCFGHVMVLWWADRFEEHRENVDMETDLPYAPGARAGLFATRSPVRPNPIGVNIAEIRAIDFESGILEVDEIDAFDGTPVLDIKPYYGCIDRVRDYSQPSWVPGEWGEWYEPLPEINYG